MHRVTPVVLLLALVLFVLFPTGGSSATNAHGATSMAGQDFVGPGRLTGD
jgi:hypothetical protein